MSEQNLEKLAYSLSDFAAAVSMSDEFLRQQVAAGKLTPSFAGRKMLIRKEEGERWLRSLPPERAA